MKLAIQLYTLRDLIKNGEDLLNILEKVKELGFDGVEFAGYFGLDAKTLKAKLDELGLVAVGTHIKIENYLPENIEKTAEFHKTLGCLYIGVGGADNDTVEECERTGDILKKGAEVTGITTYYHNHTEEFKPLENGRTAMDIIGERTKLELDTYWSFYAGIDNYKYITEHKDNIILIHIKDGIDGTPKALKEGNNDLDAVVKASKDIGVEWLVLENDNPVPDGLSDAARSMEYLKTVR